MQSENVAVLWQRFREGDEQAREELICYYLPLVQQVVNRFAPFLPHSVEVEDLISYGIVGLISAMERFDPDKNVKFETFAYWRIKGEILDFLRKEDIIPKHQRVKIKQVKNKYLELGILPGDQEGEERVAEDLGMDLEEVKEAIRLSHLTNLISLNESIGEEIMLEDAIPSPGDPYEKVEKRLVREFIENLISKMDKRQQVILDLYFNEGLTLREIGQILDLSEGRVSQLLSASLFFLRMQLEKEGVV